jgi:hypothetical protein
VRHLGLEAEQVRLIGVDFRGVGGAIDLGKQVALLDGVADLDVELLQLTGNLCADIDILERLQRPERSDGILDVGTLTTALACGSGASAPLLPQYQPVAAKVIVRAIEPIPTMRRMAAQMFRLMAGHRAIGQFQRMSKFGPALRSGLRTA